MDPPTPTPAAPAPERHFCRFTARPEGNEFGVAAIPASGFCLNAFLIVHPPTSRREVLVGRVDPRAPWGALGALDPSRLAAHQHGWMLPASQLLYGEDPADGIRRLQREMLSGLPLRTDPPRILSEVYPSKRHPTAVDHWDLSFVVEATALGPDPPPLGPTPPPRPRRPRP